MLDLLQGLRRCGKRIVAVSDMYLSADEIRALLAHHGIAVDAVFSSADVAGGDTAKHNGRLYDHVLTTLGLVPSAVLHIGDNLQSDVRRAAEKGIAAVHVPKAADLLFTDLRFNLHSIHELAQGGTLFGRTVVGLVAARRIADYFGTEFNYARYLGYLYGGPLLFGFAKYLIACARRDGVKKLLLMARDGEIIVRVLDLLPEAREVTYEVIHASRRMFLFPLLSDPEQHQGLLWTLINTHTPSATLRSELRRFGIDVADRIIAAEGKRADDPIRPAELWDVLVRHRALIRPQAETEHAAVAAYLRSKVGSTPDEVALVDVGWGLRSHDAIDRMLGLKLRGYYLGSHATAYDNGRIRGYLYSQGQPALVATSLQKAVDLIELIFSWPSPSVRTVETTGTGAVQPVYEAAGAYESARRLVVHDIHDGVFDALHDMALSPIFSTMWRSRRRSCRCCRR